MGVKELDLKGSVGCVGGWVLGICNAAFVAMISKEGGTTKVRSRQLTPGTEAPGKDV